MIARKRHKNIIKEKLNSIKNERRTVGQLAVENCDAYEEMDKDCSDFGINEGDESDQFTFCLVGIMEDDTVTGLCHFEDDIRRPTPVTRCKSYFSGYYHSKLAP